MKITIFINGIRSLLHSVAESNHQPLWHYFDDGGVEMTGDNDLVTLAEALPGVLNEQGTRIAAGMLTPFRLAPGAEKTGEAPKPVRGDKEVNQLTDQTIAQEGAVKAVTLIASVDQVTVAKKDLFATVT
jgi:hypothetical protein